MVSKVAQYINLKYNPVAIIWSDQRPDNALCFKEGKSGWQGCILWFYADVMRGATAVFDYDSIGCPNGLTSIGFGNQIPAFGFSIDCFLYLISEGNNNFEEGKNFAQTMPSKGYSDLFIDVFLEGEAKKKTYEISKKAYENWFVAKASTKYVIFKPLKDVDPLKDDVKIISFPVNAYQLSALTTLANFENPAEDSVICPSIAGACQGIGTFVYRESISENPRAVIGLKETNPLEDRIGGNTLLFSVPIKMYYDMERNCDHSLLNRRGWKTIKETEFM